MEAWAANNPAAERLLVKRTGWGFIGELSNSRDDPAPCIKVPD
jgi:hypothetical protein